MIALSWSRLNTYMECPRKFHLNFITKSFPPESEKSIHLVKGEQLHKQMEEYVVAKRGDGSMPLGFSPEVKQSLPYVDKLFTLYDEVYPEAQVAFTIDWKPTEWFGKDVAWRAIWDVIGLKANRCFIGDWKSGKVYPYGDGSFGQLHLSALCAMMKWPEVPQVDCAYVYLEHKVVTSIKVSREPGQMVNDKPVAHVAEVKTYFERWFDKVQHEKAWEPTPNENCKWCPATRAQCKFSRKL